MVCSFSSTLISFSGRIGTLKVQIISHKLPRYILIADVLNTADQHAALCFDLKSTQREFLRALPEIFFIRDSPEIANGKLTFESTFGQNGTEPVPHVVQFPEVIVAKKAVAKKKAA